MGRMVRMWDIVVCESEKRHTQDRVCSADIQEAQVLRTVVDSDEEFLWNSLECQVGYRRG